MRAEHFPSGKPRGCRGVHFSGSRRGHAISGHFVPGDVNFDLLVRWDFEISRMQLMECVHGHDGVLQLKGGLRVGVSGMGRHLLIAPEESRGPRAGQLCLRPRRLPPATPPQLAFRGRVGGAGSKPVSAMNNTPIRIVASAVKDINQENGAARGRDKVAPNKTESLPPVVSFAVWARPRISTGQVYRVGGTRIMKGDEADE